MTQCLYNKQRHQKDQRDHQPYGNNAVSGRRRPVPKLPVKHGHVEILLRALELHARRQPARHRVPPASTLHARLAKLVFIFNAELIDRLCIGLWSAFHHVPSQVTLLSLPSQCAVAGLCVQLRHTLLASNQQFGVGTEFSFRRLHHQTNERSSINRATKIPA